MNKNRSFHFLIVDDSYFDTRIAEKVIENVDRSLGVTSFKDAGLALEHIKEGGVTSGNKLCVILLDMYMPAMDGFEFLAAFDELPPEITSCYRIIMLSASIAIKDPSKGRSLMHTNVVNLEKPLSETKLILKLDAFEKMGNATQRP